MNKLCMYLS